MTTIYANFRRTQLFTSLDEVTDLQQRFERFAFLHEVSRRFARSAPDGTVPEKVSSATGGSRRHGSHVASKGHDANPPDRLVRPLLEELRKSMRGARLTFAISFSKISADARDSSRGHGGACISVSWPRGDLQGSSCALRRLSRVVGWHAARMDSLSTSGLVIRGACRFLRNIGGSNLAVNRVTLYASQRLDSRRERSDGLSVFRGWRSQHP